MGVFKNKPMATIKLMKLNTSTNKFEVVREKHTDSKKARSEAIRVWSNEIQNLQGFAIDICNLPKI